MLDNTIMIIINTTIARPRKKESDEEGGHREVWVVGGPTARHDHHQRTRPGDGHHHHRHHHHCNHNHQQHDHDHDQHHDNHQRTRPGDAHHQNGGNDGVGDDERDVKMVEIKVVGPNISR